jgi:translation initiation factor IF-2
MAKKEGVEIRTYNVIYEALDDVKAAMAGLLAPDQAREGLGQAEVRETFGIPKVGTVAGCYVTDGKMLRNGKARLVRDSTRSSGSKTTRGRWPPGTSAESVSRATTTSRKRT